MMLENKIALVTGGTSGIGRATAIAMGAAGAKVVFSGRRDTEGKETAALICETGAECLFVRSDMSREADIQALVEKTVAAYGKLDCAFNNAGTAGVIKPMQELEEFDKLIALNVQGLFLCMKYQIQQMLSQGSGAIVNTSSIIGLIGSLGLSPYVASKHAVVGLTRSAALDYAKQGIQINTVSPGSIATVAMDELMDQLGGTVDDMGSSVPMGRIGQPAEIAQTVVFLCSDVASYITGQPLAVDGGFTAT